MSAGELWQLYDDQAKPLLGKGGSKDEVFIQGLLHGAAHVWIWRQKEDVKEVLLQKRASTKPTWPNLLDISAAGHVDLGETPVQAAIRETKEEIGLTVAAEELNQFNVFKAYLIAENGFIENEFQWLYALQITDAAKFTLQDSELDSIEWVPIDSFAAECTGDKYVPHGQEYYDLVIKALSESN